MEVAQWLQALNAGALAVASLCFGYGVYMLAQGRLIAKPVADAHNQAIKETAIEASKEAGAEAAKVILQELSPIITKAVSNTLKEALGTQDRLNSIDQKVADLAGLLGNREKGG